MQNFIFDNKTTIIFGKDTQSQVGLETKKYGKTVLLHFGGGSIKASGLYDEVVHSLKKEGLKIVELGGVKPNPRLSLVKEGIKLCIDQKIDFILAVGGGSVIDSAKAIAIGAKYEGDVWDFFTGKAEIKVSLPLGVVLTIPAAGSEASTGCVITNEDGWYKRSCGSVLIRPQYAIMNPVLTYTLPSYQTACGATDMIAHVMERYFTNELDVDFTDHLCEVTIKTIMKHTKIVLKDPSHYATRAELMWAGTIAHNGLLGTGRIEDWGSHDIEHELSGIYDIAHGAGLAIVFPAWMKYVYKHDVNRFVQFAHRVFNVDIDFNNPESTALEGIHKLQSFLSEIGLPTSLKDVNIPSDRLEEMAKKATESNSLGNFVKLHEKDVLAILQIAAE
ncbi:MAG: butanol dehydrogenase [Haloplasmataceae bacterium]|jgi:alcohol dehydrogenase YqhD (iron-dependent ADH family)|nr:butanol dehydrogenase [Haloplasmataceae bacterium]